MTHQRTKERLIEEFRNLNQEMCWVTDTETPEVIDFLSHAMDEAAHATEKAGEVEEVALPTRPCVNAEQHMFGTCFACEKTKGINAAIAQSRRQLDAHFKEVLLTPSN